MRTRLLYLATCLWLCVACSKDDDAPLREEFVDKNFIELLHTEYNVPVIPNGTIDLDDEMTHLRLKAIVNLAIGYIQINDLTGIHNLTSLDKLFLVSKIERIDLSGMKYLSILRSLNLEDLYSLNQLDCKGNNLSTLDASGMKLLDNKLDLECGEQKDENGNARTLHLVLSESQRQAWLEKVAESADTNANVEVTFK